MPFLDNNGLARLWQQIIARLNGKVEKSEFDELKLQIDVVKEEAKQPIVTASSSDGVAYTATVSNMDTLIIGKEITIIPSVVSASTTPTLDVNGTGVKTIRRRVSNSTASTAAGYNASWLAANKPISVTYDGTFWVADLHQTSAADISGTLPITKGGTGTNLTYTKNALVRFSSTEGQMSTTPIQEGAMYATEADGAVQFGALPLSQGGTGIALTRTSNAIIRYSSSTNSMASTPTANGAFYATGANAKAVFGTLPVAQGGTGATSVSEAQANLGITSISDRLSALEASVVTVHSGTESEMTSSVGSDGDIYLVTE